MSLNWPFVCKPYVPTITVFESYLKGLRISIVADGYFNGLSYVEKYRIWRLKQGSFTNMCIR